MKYKVEDIKEPFDAKILEKLESKRYTIKINNSEHQLEILSMSDSGIEFILDQKYHKAVYIDQTTNQMDLVVNNTPITLYKNTHFDDIVYKNSGGGGPGNAQFGLKSQIPGKVVSIAVTVGDNVNKGDTICVLESMKMQVAVKAHKNGSIHAISIKEGNSVAKGDTIAEIE